MNEKTTTITINAAEAELLAELTDRAAVTGQQARTLADLYDKTHAARDELRPPKAAEGR